MRPPATTRELQEMINLRLEHATWREIAGRFGYPDATVRLSVTRAVKNAGDERLLARLRGWRAYPPSAHLNRAGYMRLRMPGHPLASARGRVFEHRMVLYNRIGAGPHPCELCGEILKWPEIVVDHVNCVRTDNRLENLRVCCRGCNARRGSMRRWYPGRDYPAWMDDPDCPDDFEGWEAA